MICETALTRCLSWSDTVLILVLMEDALRELILRRPDCQLVTVPFSENPLDFREKSVPNCPQIYEFPRSPHEATHYTEWLHLRFYQGIRKMPRWRLWIIQWGTNKFFRSFIWFLRSFISSPRGGFSFSTEESFDFLDSAIRSNAGGYRLLVVSRVVPTTG